MSEYQFLAFRAVDRHLTDKELEFARSQSSRAEITPWSMENEYHFGDFRGDAEKLLQRGFDVHLHYANFGIRKIMLRMPGGLPGAKSVWSPYVDGDQVSWKKDKRGPGGILTIQPAGDAATFDQLWETGPGTYIERLQSLRNDLVNGDLRPLYVFWLCGQSGDYGDDPEELIEPPVPAGLAEASEAGRYLLGFFDTDSLMLDAAGEIAAPMTKQSSPHQQIETWVQKLKSDDARALLTRILTEEDAAGARAETLARIRNEAHLPVWPTSPGKRTLAALQERAGQLRAEADAKERARRDAAAKREAQRKQRERQKRLKQMVKSPQKWLDEADQLVEARGTANYHAAAEILADLYADSAAADFDVAAGKFGTINRVDFEGLVPGFFNPLALPGVTFSYGGDFDPVMSGVNENDSNTDGYNTTFGGEQHLRVSPSDRDSFGDVILKLTFDDPIQAFGAYYTGIEEGVDGRVTLEFNNGMALSYGLCDQPVPGVKFFGFIDEGASISAVVFRETDDSPGPTRDIWGIDDIRYVSIPEPGGMWLLALGLSAAAVRYRRGD